MNDDYKPQRKKMIKAKLGKDIFAPKGIVACLMYTILVLMGVVVFMGVGWIIGILNNTLWIG